MDIKQALLAALLGEVAITDLLGSFQGEPSIHTRRPPPDDAEYPMIIISPDVTHGDEDALVERRDVIVRDIAIYGEQKDDYRNVETIAYLVRDLFHRQRESFSPDGGRVIDVVAKGPMVGPTDDPKKVARIVEITARVSITS